MTVGADGKIVLSFNLLNTDPRDWTYDWKFQEIDDNLLAPILKSLMPLADIRVESQVLYHTPKSSFSYWDEKLGSYITTKDLPFFVNSNEWHLDTSVAAGGRSKILHLVVYVPSATECPLAEDAFYHPSTMSMSYYLFEHCFAVYSPFFRPVSLHVLLAALREWKRYKHETRKYHEILKR